jgi:hypothetical protein
MSLKPTYTKAEVATMCADMLLDEFERICGHYELYCSHCRGHKSIRTHFVGAIRSQCMKPSSAGLSPDLKLPKTCDLMRSINAYANPVNNPVYAAMRKTEDADEKLRLELERRAAHLERGIVPRALKVRIERNIVFAVGSQRLPDGKIEA